MVGILTPQEAFSGFGSVAVIMVTAMFVFSAALVRTGAAEMIGGRLFRACADDELRFQIAVLALATACSMFINETTIVLVFMPVILGVCKERNLSPSRYLMCAAYGAALGGQWTLIGTRSNIIVSEFFRQRTGQGIGFFDFTPLPSQFSLAVRPISSWWDEDFADTRRAIVGAGTGQGISNRGDGYTRIDNGRIDPRPTRLGQTAGRNHCRRHPRGRTDAA